MIQYCAVIHRGGVLLQSSGRGARRLKCALDVRAVVANDDRVGYGGLLVAGTTASQAFGNPTVVIFFFFFFFFLLSNLGDNASKPADRRDEAIHVNVINCYTPLSLSYSEY